MIPFISLSYTFGSRTVLNKGWKWDNVITPDNKLYFVEEGEHILNIGDNSGLYIFEFIFEDGRRSIERIVL